MRWEFTLNIPLYKPEQKPNPAVCSISNKPRAVMNPDPEDPCPSAGSTPTEMTEKATNAQVVTYKDSFLQVIHTVAQKSFERACQLFCIPRCEKVRCCSAQKPLPVEEENTLKPFQSSPSTILIVNISNSTLIDCVIGDSYPCAAAEQQRLMQDGSLQKPAQVRCSCGYGQQGAALPSPPHASGGHPNISISSSRLNCVIIGDNNYMQAELSGSVL